MQDLLPLRLFPERILPYMPCRLHLLTNTLCKYYCYQPGGDCVWTYTLSNIPEMCKPLYPPAILFFHILQHLFLSNLLSERGMVKQGSTEYEDKSLSVSARLVQPMYQNYVKLHIILIMKRKMLCEVNQAISVEFTQNSGDIVSLCNYVLSVVPL